GERGHRSIVDDDDLVLALADATLVAGRQRAQRPPTLAGHVIEDDDHRKDRPPKPDPHARSAAGAVDPIAPILRRTVARETTCTIAYSLEPSASSTTLHGPTVRSVESCSTAGPPVARCGAQQAKSRITA